MNETDAAKLVHKYLCEHIELELCTETPKDLYNFRHEDECLFRFKLFGHLTIGSSEYIAINKSTGSIRHIGFLEE